MSASLRRFFVGFSLLGAAATATTAAAQLPPIMNPPNAQWYLWTCYGTSTLSGQTAICGQAYGYNDYWARYNCGSTFVDVKCYPTGL